MQQSNVPEPVAFQLLQNHNSQKALTAVGCQGMLEIVVLQLQVGEHCIKGYSTTLIG